MGLIFIPDINVDFICIIVQCLFYLFFFLFLQEVVFEGIAKRGSLKQRTSKSFIFYDTLTYRLTINMKLVSKLLKSSKKRKFFFYMLFIYKNAIDK